MHSVPAWGERGSLVAFTERGDLTILMFLYDNLIVTDGICGQCISKLKIFNRSIQLWNYKVSGPLIWVRFVCLFTSGH